MLVDVLAYMAAHEGAPVTEIKRVFELPSDMAANLLVQLVDAGFLFEQPLSACHHMDEHGHAIEGGCGSAGCGSGGCGSGGTSCAVGDAFERGCCGMNSPYRVTDGGRDFLVRMRAIA
jgi:hypothetical protein